MFVPNVNSTSSSAKSFIEVTLFCGRKKNIGDHKVKKKKKKKRGKKKRKKIVVLHLFLTTFFFIQRCMHVLHLSLKYHNKMPKYYPVTKIVIGVVRLDFVYRVGSPVFCFYG